MKNAPHGVRTAVAYTAVAGVAILALGGLNVAADKLPFAGLTKLRDYLTQSK